MTETGHGRGSGDHAVETTRVHAVDGAAPGRRHAAPDHLAADGQTALGPAGDLPDDTAGPDMSGRRRAAEAAARAAEVRAAEAAADAKAAIALAARAAAAADAAAQAAEQADAAVRAAAAAEARAPRPAVDVPPAPMPAPPIPAPPMAAAPMTGASGRHGAHPVDLGDPIADTDTMHRAVVPAPRGAARHGDHGPDTGGEPVAGGRAARRRAAAAETTVFAVPADGYADEPYDRDDEPVTDLVDTAAASGGPESGGPGSGGPDEPATALIPGRRARRAAAEPVEDTPVDDADTEPDEAPKRGRAARRSAAGGRRLFGRRRAPVLAAAAAGGVLALTGIVLATSGGGAGPAPASMVEASSPAVPQLPADAAAADEAAPEEGGDVAGATDPLSDRGSTFLRALREAGVPTSQGGADEIEAADLVCESLDDGVDEARIARALPASLPTVTRAQAADLVEVAKENYCN